MRALRRAGEADVTLVVLDYDGVWHEVYNKREVREVRESHNDWVENWQIRTLCCRNAGTLLLQPRISRAIIDDENGTGHVPTCVRCLCLPCDHGIVFDEAQARQLGTHQVRTQWPRLDGPCPKGCGYVGIFYASHAHYIYGDW